MRPDSRPLLSIVAPLYNEERNLRPLVLRLVPVLEGLGLPFEALFVDDGSTDGTLEALRELCAADPRLKAISFSRNFGKEIAIAAGLDHARGAAVVVMDSDLQHPPEIIPLFVEKWRAGYENVYGERVDRASDPRIRVALTRIFYTLIDHIGDVVMPAGAGDFRLLDRKAVDALCAMRERARFNKGLFAWIGFKTIGVPFMVEQRAHGASTFNFARLLRFALDGVMSFSSIPLRMWTFFGLLISGCALAMAAWFFFKTMILGVDTPGFATLIVSIAFFSGVQLISLGVIGEYIGRIFSEVKGRPLYLVAERIGSHNQGGPLQPAQGPNDTP
ncbi:glycosyltransferase family 2 protein [Methylocystis bryophila]|uniref:Glycosyltransferase n=1 Tax=Methylocystis bryophila TaxID=655015 RepID=A0A1W6MSN8_9HYPH|nr:glycosyltransferase family 2 protein [Methylocystis bryophila]ARN80577.1 glycosyltransferase [Methylocystis bryophila]BDV40628.1 glycosyl transferase [Methylocystis bryophila]